MKPGDKIMPFGQFKGKTFQEIADTNDGLAYLNKVIKKITDKDFKENLKAFLESIRKNGTQ